MEIGDIAFVKEDILLNNGEVINKGDSCEIINFLYFHNMVIIYNENISTLCKISYDSLFTREDKINSLLNCDDET